MSNSDISKAKLDPASVYPSPSALVSDDSLDRAEKLALLDRWEADARQLAVAEEENMGGGEPSRLDEIIACRRQLCASDGSLSSAPNKQGVSADLTVSAKR